MTMEKKKHYRPEYFEAIIQLRPPTDEVFDFIMKQLKKREEVFISKIEEFKFGIDIYISSQKFARSLAKKIKDNFKGEMKISASIHSRDRQSSKERHRITVLYRPELPEEEE